MASLTRELSLHAAADAVWDALRDFGAVHERVAPGFVVAARLESPTCRTVSFANGHTARETLVAADDTQRRLVYAIFNDRLQLYNAAVQVHPQDATHCRLTWHIDLLPETMAPYIAAQMDLAVQAMKPALEGAGSRLQSGYPQPQPIVLQPIGVVRSNRADLIDDAWDGVTASVHLDANQFGPEALAGLDTYSHVEVVFHMDRVRPGQIERGARHPRERTDWPQVGIFAQRGKARPNRVGCSICRIVRLEGRVLHVQGLDAVDGTPVIDLKPWVRQFGPRGEVVQPAWMDALMEHYW